MELSWSGSKPNPSVRLSLGEAGSSKGCCAKNGRFGRWPRRSDSPKPLKAVGIGSWRLPYRQALPERQVAPSAASAPGSGLGVFRPGTVRGAALGGDPLSTGLELHAAQRLRAFWRALSGGLFSDQLAGVLPDGLQS